MTIHDQQDSCFPCSNPNCWMVHWVNLPTTKSPGGTAALLACTGGQHSFDSWSVLTQGNLDCVSLPRLDAQDSLQLVRVGMACIFLVSRLEVQANLQLLAMSASNTFGHAAAPILEVQADLQLLAVV